MKFINKNAIKLDKVINELDKFVLGFIKILEKHTDYVIISGYVSILLGRSRSTEDVDMFVKPLDKQAFLGLYKELVKNGFWCLNAESIEEVYSYLKDGLAVRFAKKDQTIPNFEVKFTRKPLDLGAFDGRITVQTGIGEIKISSLERQIAFKRYYLKSDKDLEDAAHIEKLFNDKLDKALIQTYKNLIEKEAYKK